MQDVSELEKNQPQNQQTIYYDKDRRRQRQLKPILTHLCAREKRLWDHRNGFETQISDVFTKYVSIEDLSTKVNSNRNNIVSIPSWFHFLCYFYFFRFLSAHFQFRCIWRMVFWNECVLVCHSTPSLVSISMNNDVAFLEFHANFLGLEEVASARWNIDRSTVKWRWNYPFYRQQWFAGPH